jgi:hypothetical protein
LNLATRATPGSAFHSATSLAAGRSLVARSSAELMISAFFGALAGSDVWAVTLSPRMI